MTPALLRAQGISVRRGHRTVVEPCDLSVEPGDRIAIYGPNGAGKSSLLQALAGLLPAATGSVSFQGKALGQEVSLLEFHRRTAAVFQEPLLLRGTVRHNVELGLKLRGMPGPRRSARIQPWLNRLRIAHLAERPVGLLSGGEAQRTSIARALVLEPEILFLDEPFASLDAPTRTRLVEEFAQILDEQQIATLFVTHDINEAAELCHRCMVIDAGRVLQHGKMATVLERPASRRVAEIIGIPNVFEGQVVEAGPGGSRLDWDGHRIHTVDEAQVGARVTFLIRQDRIHLREDPPKEMNRLPGLVNRIRRRGKGRVISVEVERRHRIEVRSDSSTCASPGEEVTMMFSPDAVWVFPSAPT